MNIFNDGYLDIQYLNPNYRGIVGFPADWWIALHMEDEHWEEARILTTHLGKYVSNGFATINYWNDDFCRLRVEQFAMDDIPLEEYCWSKLGGGEWKKETRLEFITAYDEIVFKNEIDEPLYCVPTLIAETKEDAEKLKDWDNPDEAKHNTVYIGSESNVLVGYGDAFKSRRMILDILDRYDDVLVVFDDNIEKISMSFIIGLTEGIPKHCITFKSIHESIHNKLNFVFNDVGI